MTFSGHCHSGCQSWPAPLPGGYMDVSSNSQPAIYALGPRESLTSNDPAAPVKMHAEFGTFEIDMRRTFGNTDSPSLSEESVSKGTTAGETKTGLVDAMSTAHAVFMVLVFVVLLPLGALLPRFADSVKGHGVVQGVSLVGGLVGFGLGVRASFNYQRVSRIARVCAYLANACSPADSYPPTRSSASSSSQPSSPNCKAPSPLTSSTR